MKESEEKKVRDALIQLTDHHIQRQSRLLEEQRITTQTLKSSIAYDSLDSVGKAPEVEDRYYTLNEVLQSISRIPILKMLSKRYNLSYEKDYNDMWPSDERFIRKISNNHWTLAYSDAARELSASWERMPLHPDHFIYRGKTIYIYPECDRVIFSGDEDVHVINSWNITKDQVIEAVKEVVK